MNSEQKRQNKLTVFLKELKSKYHISQRLTNQMKKYSQTIEDEQKYNSQPMLKKDSRKTMSPDQIAHDLQKEYKYKISFQNRIKDHYLRRINRQIVEIKLRSVSSQNNFVISTMVNTEGSAVIQQTGSQSILMIEPNSCKMIAKPVLVQEKNESVRFKQQQLKDFKDKLDESQSKFTNQLYGFFRKSSEKQNKNQISELDLQNLKKTHQLKRGESQSSLIQTSQSSLKRISSKKEIKDYAVRPEPEDLSGRICEFRANKEENKQFYDKYSEIFNVQSSSRKSLFHLQKRFQVDVYREQKNKQKGEMHFLKEEIKAYKETKSLSTRQLEKKIKLSIQEVLNSGYQSAKVKRDFEKKQTPSISPNKLNRLQSAAFYRNKIDEVPGKLDAFEFYQSLHIHKKSGKIGNSLKKMNQFNERNIKKLIKVTNKYAQ